MPCFALKMEAIFASWCPLVRVRIHGVITQNITFISYITVLYSGLVEFSGQAVAQLVEALRYKPERRGFDSRL